MCPAVAVPADAEQHRHGAELDDYLPVARGIIRTVSKESSAFELIDRRTQESDQTAQRSHVDGYLDDWIDVNLFVSFASCQYIRVLERRISKQTWMSLVAQGQALIARLVLPLAVPSTRRMNRISSTRSADEQSVRYRTGRRHSNVRGVTFGIARGVDTSLAIERTE